MMQAKQPKKKAAFPVQPFHMAIPVLDLEETKAFYTNLFGATIGRETDKWVDFNFYGHQLSVHKKPTHPLNEGTSNVDNKQVPVRHFGVVLDWDVWHALADKLKARSTAFMIEPYVRFEGHVGEQATMFLLDPSGNALEFKSFKDPSQLFAK